MLVMVRGMDDVLLVCVGQDRYTMGRYCPYVPSGSHVSSENCQTQEGHGLGMSVAMALVRLAGGR